MFFSVLFPNSNGDLDIMEEVEYDVLPNYVEDWNLGDNDKDASGNPLTKKIHFLRSILTSMTNTNLFNAITS